MKPEQIDAIDYLRQLNPMARRELAARAVTRTVAKGGRLWIAGSEPRGLFILLSGRVRVVGTKGRRQHVLHTEGAGATLGEVPLFSGGTYPATAIAEEASRCLVIDRITLAIAMRADPQLAWTLLGRLADRVRHLVERLSAQTADPVRARLARYLVTRPVRRDGTISLGGTQQQIAEEIGTVREVVVRLLRRWVRDGVLLPKGRGAYVLTDARHLDIIPVAGRRVDRRPSPGGPARNRPTPPRAAARAPSRRS